MHPSEDSYRLLSKGYDCFVGPALQRVRHHCLELLPLESPVLDLACGTGLLLMDIARLPSRSHRLVGIDRSPSMLAQAVRKHASIPILWVQGDGRQMPFPSEAFAAVSILFALHEMATETRMRVFEETSRVLQRAGRLIAADYDVERFRSGSALSRVSAWGTHLVERFAGRAHYRHFRQFLKEGGLTAIVEKAGFSIMESRRIEGHQAIIVSAARQG